MLKENMTKNVNEGQYEGWYVNALKAIGLRKGFPDYVLILPNNKYHSLWIEMKRVPERGKKMRQEQIEWIERLNKNGHYASFTFGADEAIQICNDYLNNKL